MTSALTKEQRSNAIQRLTALWAFTESGLGGVMHALHIPFTGLLVGGMAVVMICLIAEFSEHNYRLLLKSLIIVLIVKAMAGPFTPVTAYIAVSFQALLGYTLFSLFGVSVISMVLLSIIAILESAIQKLLVLTLFFGQSIWKAADSMVAFAGEQLGHIISNGSYWIMAVYLFIYLAGGIFIAWLSYTTIHSFNAGKPGFVLKETYPINPVVEIKTNPAGKKMHRKLWLLIVVMIAISLILFVFAANKKEGWIEVIKTISWTTSAVLVWFVLIGPLITQGIQKLLKKKQSGYSDEVLQTLAFIPVLKQLAAAAWQQSKLQQGFKRWSFFFTALIYTTLTWSGQETITQQPLNKTL
jgi:hypothetical protein